MRSSLVLRAAVLFLSGNLLAATDAVVLEVDTTSNPGPVYSFWSTTVMPIQDQFLAQSPCASIRRERPFATHINLVRFLGGRGDGKNEFFQGVGPDGKVRCDFTGAEAILRSILKCGFTPRIVLDNVPAALSQTNELHKYGITAPPKDFDLWHAYIRQFTEMLVREFGRQEVSRWRFRVGTEPDLFPSHWSGSKEDYLRHYDYTVDAVLGVIPEADIGPGNILNPGEPGDETKRKKWGLDIIDHCATGTNYKTGKIGTRMRFLGFSYYGRVGRGIETFDNAVARIRERLSRHPQFARVPVEVQESLALMDEKGKWCRNGEGTEWAAAWMAALADRTYRHGVAEIYEWPTTYGGLPNPRTQVLRLLQRMEGGQRLAARTSSPGETGCIASKSKGGFDLLVYRHQAGRDDGEPAQVRLELSGPDLAANRREVKQAFVIDRNHSGYMHAFYKDAQAAGLKPRPDTGLYQVHIPHQFGDAGRKLFLQHRNKYETLAALAPLTPAPVAVKTDSGKLLVTLQLTGHSVVYLRVE